MTCCMTRLKIASRKCHCQSTPLTLFEEVKISLDATRLCGHDSVLPAVSVILQLPKGIGYVASRPGWSYLFSLPLSSPQRRSPVVVRHRRPLGHRVSRGFQFVV